MAVVLATVATTFPAGAATPDIVITAGAGDVPITEVELIDNGTAVTQTASAPLSLPGRVTDSDDDVVTFSSITVDDGGPVVLDEFNVGSATNFQFPPNSSGVSTFENGTATLVGSADFEPSVTRVLQSTDLRDYIGYDAISAEVSGNTLHDFDVVFDEPNRNSDYLVITERNGNTFLNLVALDKVGNVIPGSNVVGIDSDYAWNTGFAPSNQADQPMFFTVIDIASFGVDSAVDPIYGFRIDNDGEADIKLFAAAADPFLPTMTLDKTVYVGHDSGASCGSAGELVTVADGDNITFCFNISNNGEADLDNLTITDADLGLADVDATDAGTFTQVSGSLPIPPGETLVLAYETTSAGAVTNTATAIADVMLPSGGVNTVLSPEFDTDTAEVAAAPAVAPASISGTVVDNNGDPIAGVVIELTGDATASTTTAADGTYSFTDLAPGTYTVTETTPAGYLDGGETAGSEGGTVSDDVISDIILAAGDDSIANDFDEQIPASISGTVVDELGNPIAGVTVTLSGDATMTAVTDADGNYTFTGLAAGTYTVTESQPEGFGDGADTAGSAGGTVTNDVIADIVLAAGVASVDNDFAEVLQVTPALPVTPELPATGSQTPLILAYGFLLIVSGAILTLAVSQVGRARKI